MSNPICIIGSGLAGYNLARDIRRADKEVPLYIITEDDGSYYSKPQLSSAVSQDKKPDQLAMLSVDKMRDQLKATILNHTRITHIDTEAQTIQTDAEETIAYSKLVLACGAEVISIPLTGDAADQVLSVNNLEDYRVFRQSLLKKQHITIIGSGLIGCEFANDLLNIEGITVEVISLSETPLPQLLPPEIGESVASCLATHGIKWHFNASVQSVNHTDSEQFEVKTSTGETITTDLVLSAVGIRPNLHLATQAELDTSKGIVVNQYLETSASNVYALGDCAEICGHVYQYILPLNYAVKALAKTLTSDKTPVTFPAMPISIKTPLCPIVVALPPATAQGSWSIQKAGHHIKATFIDAGKEILGFVLTGDRVKERLELTTILPDVLTATN